MCSLTKLDVDWCNDVGAEDACIGECESDRIEGVGTPPQLVR